MIKLLTDIDVFNLSYRFAMDVFMITRHFPREETYSLTGQVVRSSRSIAVNIAEGFGKRSYENEFKKHLIYAMGSLEETKVWLLFARDCGYLNATIYGGCCIKYDEIGAKLYKLYENWRTF